MQRVFEHSSHLGYEYVADELSFPIPGGLSGGPVVFDRNPWELTGIAAESIAASTYIHNVQELIEPGREVKVSEHRVVEYGVAVRLESILDWVNELVPPPAA